MDLNKIIKGFEERKISKEIVLDALKEAMAKAYRKHLDIPDLLVRVDITPSKGIIHVYQQRTVVEVVEDDELEISLETALIANSEAKLGDLVDQEVNVEEFSRAAAVLAKNVLKQKIREAEKSVVYDEYCDKISEMVTAKVEYVEKEKFVNVKLSDNVVAMMPRTSQIPGEQYVEGQMIKVVISEVNRETKGAQVLVSRSDAALVKRLFELEVPEIYDGTVEIKAIAREAGERTKMAVYSHINDIDAIGACIGQKGIRVQKVMDEINGEKVDIFEWSDDSIQLIKNALSPALVLGVIESFAHRGLTVIVPDNQLSLAIGKKGKNARLAVRLTNLKIDIKSESDMIDKGIDYQAIMLKTMPSTEEKITKDVKKEVITPEIEIISEPITDVITSDIETSEVDTHEVDMISISGYEIPINTTEEVIAASLVKEAREDAKEHVSEIRNAKAIKEEFKNKAIAIKETKERGVRTDYVSRFEKFATSTSGVVEEPAKRVYKKRPIGGEEERRIRINLKDVKYEVKPEYTEAELEEIKANEMIEKEATWYNEEIDFDEYDEYYDEEEK